jgi:UDP-glucose 4-epimerase
VLTRSSPADEVLAAIGPDNLHLGDAADAADLNAVLGEVRHVVYTAGGLLPAASEENPERDASLTLAPLRGVLEALRERPGVRLSYVSSGGTVYGQPERLPVSEEAPTRPLGTYGRLHLICEEEIERYRVEHSLPARILRCSTVYGEHQQPDRGQGAVATFLHRIERGKPIHLYGDGGTIRDYVYAGDVAKTLVRLIDRKDGPMVLNVGSGKGTSLRELLELVERETGRRATVEQRGERGFDVHAIVLDSSRLRAMLDFEPTPIEDGIARTHEWLKRAEAPSPLRTAR